MKYIIIRKKCRAVLLLMMTVLITVSLKTLAGDLRREHPRPDLYRENWLSLNGDWQFEIDKADDGELRGLNYGKDLNKKIIVPFCPESKLSGLGFNSLQYNLGKDPNW